MTTLRWGHTDIELVQGDITQQGVDAIVNAANSGLMGGGGVDGAIHRAGGPEILAACKAIVKERGHLPPGEAVITTGGRLKARNVIHTVGPIWRGGDQGEAQVLRSCYISAITLACRYQLKSIAFPAISAGVYGYPIEMAAQEALFQVQELLTDDASCLEQVVFVLFDRQAFEVYSQILGSQGS